MLANEYTAGDLGAAGDPGQWISNWTSLLSVVSADPAAAPRVHVDLLDSPDAYGLRCAPLLHAPMEAIGQGQPDHVTDQCRSIGRADSPDASGRQRGGHAGREAMECMGR